MTHLHLRPDGSFVDKYKFDTRINVPLEFLSDHLNKDLDQDWDKITLIDPEDMSKKQELKWLTFEISLQDDDMKQQIGANEEIFIADAAVYAMS